MYHRRINTAVPSELYIAENCLCNDTLLSLCSAYQQIVIISDDNVAPLYAQSIIAALRQQGSSAELIVIPHGESSKSREMKAFIEDKLFAFNCGRDSALIALGGGVVTDLTGYVAATYLRGIPVIYIPTSLLAMVDAAIGGKTGINTPQGKNMLGTFTQPTAVFMDIHTLNTLPDDEYRYAFAEIIKHALIADADYFDFLEANVDALLQRDPQALLNTVIRSCEIKANIVEQDEKEAGLREICNLGHTIGHAIEKHYDYQMPHGHAVALGIVMEGELTVAEGLFCSKALARIKALFARYDISLAQLEDLSIEGLKTSMLRDKKVRKQQVRYVSLAAIGQARKERSILPI